MGKKKPKPQQLGIKKYYKVTYPNGPDKTFHVQGVLANGHLIIEDAQTRNLTFHDEAAFLQGSANIQEISPLQAGMPTAQDVADWMYNYLQGHAELEQEAAAQHIQGAFGDEFVYTTEDGNLGIVQPVLRRFRKLHGGAIVYDKKHHLWST